MQRVLLAVWERGVANLLAGGLRALPSALDSVEDGPAALSRAESSTDYSLIILDLMLPWFAGAQLCARIRAAQPQAPILALSARAELVASLLGMRHGVDDYLLKPFPIVQAMEKAERLLRRPRRRTAPRGSSKENWSVGGLSFHFGAKRISIAGNPIERVSAAEFDLVHFLARSAGSAFSREALLSLLWGIHHPINMRTLGINLGSLAEKLRHPLTRAPHLISVDGERWMFVDPHKDGIEPRDGEHLSVDYHT